MKYCCQCVIPDTRPNIVLDAEGRCNACGNHSGKKNIDWAERAELFRKIAETAQQRATGYDCVIPVSGGKDSFWQVVTCLQYGLKPLAVTWKTPGRNLIGQQNLERLIEMGVDHIDYQINSKVEKKFVRLALERYGSPALPMHMALFNIPLTVAVNYSIPLVVWGENSAVEYGNKFEADTGYELTSDWLRTYGVTHGTTAQDWSGDQLSTKDLTAYRRPGEEVLADCGVRAVFLGHFFRWDPQTSLATATAHGFRRADDGPKTGYYDYADIDDDFIAVHHYIKWYKFGFTRIFDNLSLEIRNRRLTRDQAVDIIASRGLETPNKDIDRLCRFLELGRDEFFRILERFRNPDVWVRQNGRWAIKDFLIQNWNWNES